MDDTFQAVHDNFLDQANHCKNKVGRLLSGWQGNPTHDAVALRFVAALHYLLITEKDSDLVKLFPPKQLTESKYQETLLRDIINRHEAVILKYLALPPQTNEVGRSMVLIGGFLEIAHRFGADMDVFEIGASAGLNSVFDQYYYKTEEWEWGDKPQGSS
jgi:hypothetical protein